MPLVSFFRCCRWARRKKGWQSVCWPFLLACTSLMVSTSMDIFFCLETSSCVTPFWNIEDSTTIDEKSIAVRVGIVEAVAHAMAVHKSSANVAVQGFLFFEDLYSEWMELP